MNKTDLTEHVSAEVGISKAEAGRAVDAVLNGIKGALQDRSDVHLAGFGSFTVVERAARKGRNPATGEPIDIAASTTAKFKAGKALHDVLN